jgi:hypothetical protein
MTKLLYTPIVLSLCLASQQAFAAEMAPAAATPLPAPSVLSTSSEASTQAKDAFVPSDLFGKRSGYIHPFMSATLHSADNINSTPTDTLSDWKAIYSPGVWLAIPAQREIFLNLNASNTSPGGRYQHMDKQEGFSRYQAYALYAADIEEYHKYDERNTVKQSGEAFFQLNLRGGLSFDVYDKYSDNEDPSGTGDTAIIDKYKSNLGGIIVDYDLTDKFRVRADYTNFDLAYDDILSQGKDRTDNSYALYTFYTISPKTELLAEYEYIDVSYDINDPQDSTQHLIYAGINWQPTVKTTIKGKAGMVDRQGEVSGASETAPIFELMISQSLTDKSSVTLSASHKLNESTISTASYSKDTTASLSLNQAFTDKLSASLVGSVTNTNFQGDGPNRTDDMYTLSPTVKYVFNDYLLGELAYEYTQRDSSDPGFEYDNNTFLLRVSTAF